MNVRNYSYTRVFDVDARPMLVGNFMQDNCSAINERKRERDRQIDSGILPK